MNPIENLLIDKISYVITKEYSKDAHYYISSKEDYRILYVISGKGKVSELTETKENGTGTNEGGGTVVVSDSEYIFEGGGLGHQIGLSQFGANAMARLGFDGTEIVEFYFPGTTVDDYK